MATLTPLSPADSFIVSDGSDDESVVSDSGDDDSVWAMDLDDDGDGQVSAEELAAACGDELLRQADTNGDGLVNFLEYMAWWNKQKQGPGSDGLKSFDR